MKKIIAVTIYLIILFCFQQINAQTFSLGARAGLSLANLSFDPDLPSYVEKSGRTTVKLGVLAEVGFANMFALQVEPMYGQGGAKLSAGGQEETDKVSYFEIPILFKVKIPVSGPVTPYAFAGPNLAFVTSAKSETGGQEYDIKDQVTSTNFGLDFGVGAGFKVAPLVSIILDVRYSLGLTNLLKEQQGTDQKIKSTGIGILTGVTVGL